MKEGKLPSSRTSITAKLVSVSPFPSASARISSESFWAWIRFRVAIEVIIAFIGCDWQMLKKKLILAR